MAKAPFTVGKAPDLPMGAANPTAGLIPAINYAGVVTQDHVAVGGGAKITDNRTVNAKLNLADGDDTYIDNVVMYSEDGDRVTQTTLPNLSDSREFMVSAPILNCIIYAGGQDEKGYSRTVELYHSFGGHRVLAALNSPKTDLAGATAGENVLFAGGDDGSGASDTIEVYGINFDKKMVCISLDEAVKGLCGCSFGDYAVFAGGRNAKGLPTDKVIAFDKNLNIIRNIEPLSEPRYNLAAAVCTNPDNPSESYLLIAGGKSTHTGFSNTVDVYDSNLKKVSAGLELSTGRSRLKGASCKGYALFAGGVVGVEPQDTPTDIVDIFNWELKRFDTMHLLDAKNSLSAAAFEDRVLFSGGYNLKGLSRTSDMFIYSGGKRNATVTYHWQSALVNYQFGS